jgi:FdhD protein
MPLAVRLRGSDDMAVHLEEDDVASAFGPDFPEAGALAAWRSCAVTRGVAPGASRRDSDFVIEEVPVSLVYNGIAHAVMLTTPCDLEDFAIGFSLAEAIVGSASEVYDVEAYEQRNGIELRLTIASSRVAALKTRRRALAGRTGCGLCGIEALAQLAPAPRRVAANGHLRTCALDTVVGELARHQTLHQRTGAAHAAVFATWEGELCLLREDVGRHNALDKLVGALALRRLDAGAGFVLVSSRASYEMVHKTACAGIGLLAALSAPTAMAIRTAEMAGVTLVGFAGREDRVLYAHPERMDRASRES